jgi:hypothetical protein
VQVTPNTTVTIWQAASINSYSGVRVDDAVVAAGVAAHLLERPATRPRTGAQGRAVESPSSDTPRILRVFSLRLPFGTPINRDSRVVDDRTGRVFGVDSARAHNNTMPDADVIVELTAVDTQDP